MCLSDIIRIINNIKSTCYFLTKKNDAKANEGQKQMRQRKGKRHFINQSIYHALIFLDSALLSKYSYLIYTLNILKFKIEL